MPPREQIAQRALLPLGLGGAAARAPAARSSSKFGIGIIETMGLTETVAPAFSNPLDPAARKIGSVGRASGCEARVVDEAGCSRSPTARPARS